MINLLFMILCVAFILSCLHQANIMSAKTPLRFKIGLILMLLSGVLFLLEALYGVISVSSIIGVSLIYISSIIWLFFDRRLGA